MICIWFFRSVILASMRSKREFKSASESFRERISSLMPSTLPLKPVTGARDLPTPLLTESCRLLIAALVRAELSCVCCNSTFMAAKF